MQVTTRRGAVIAAAVLSAAAMLVTTLSVTTVETEARSVATVDRVVEQSGIVYGSFRMKSGAKRKLRLDLWQPTSSEARRPAVILAHGGGFRRGTRKDPRIRSLAVALAEHGYVTASVSYRLRRAHSTSRLWARQLVNSGAARHAQHDVQAAVRYLRRRADHLAIDRKQIAVLGSSAGGIAALRAAFNPEDPGRSGNRRFRSDVAAVVSLWGASDRQMIEPGAPPALMFHGRDDRTVPFKLAWGTCRATRRRDNVCRPRWWSGVGHSAFDRQDEIVRRTVRFLDRHM